MPDAAPQSLGPIEKEAVKILSTGAWRLMMFLMTAILMGVAALAVFYGKNFVNTAIAQAPDVIAVHSEIKEVKTDLDGTKATAAAAGAAASAAATTAAGAVATQEKIFQLLNSDRAERAAQSAVLAATLSTLTERIAGVKEQLARVESKQDATK